MTSTRAATKRNNTSDSPSSSKQAHTKTPDDVPDTEPSLEVAEDLNWEDSSSQKFTALRICWQSKVVIRFQFHLQKRKPARD